MKKLLVRVVLLVSILIIANQQFAYADVYSPDPVREFTSFSICISFICVCVAIVAASSYFSIKKSAKMNQEGERKEDDNSTSISPEYIDKKRRQTRTIIYSCITIVSFILSLCGLIYHEEAVRGILGLSTLRNNDSLYDLILENSILVFGAAYLISLILRLCQKRKLAKIIWKINLIVICVVTLLNFLSVFGIKKNISKYVQYETFYGPMELDVNGTYIYSPYYVKDMNGLINEAIKNNDGFGRKVTLIYKNDEYKTVEELQQLLNEMDISKRYFIINEYDYLEHIKSITFVPYDDILFTFLRNKESKTRDAVDIYEMIVNIEGITDGMNSVIINMKYISEIGEELYTDFTADTIDACKNIEEIMSSNRSTDQMYSVELLNDDEIPFDVIVRPVSSEN